MFYNSRQWEFIADMNQSGSVTITDIWLWFKWLYFYPGDLIVKYFVDIVPKVGQFLELTYSHYGGFLSGTISFIAWYIVLWVAYVVFD